MLLFDSRNIYAYKTFVFFLFFVCVVAFTVAFAIEVASVIVDIVIVAVDVVDVVVVVFVVVVLAVVGVTVASSVDEPKPFRFLFIIHIGYNFENNLILKLSFKKLLKKENIFVFMKQIWSSCVLTNKTASNISSLHRMSDALPLS